MTEDAAKAIKEVHRKYGGNSSSGKKSDSKPSDKASLTCPMCHKPLIKLDWGYGCTGYKSGCSFKVGKIAGVTLTEKQMKDLTEKKHTGIIKGFEKKDKSSKFDACLKLDDDGKISFSFLNK